jgi:hypothetical protein
VCYPNKGLIAIPVLPDEMREDLSRAFNKAVDEATSSLEKLKKEICEKENPNYENIIVNLGILGKHDSILTRKRTRAQRTLPPFLRAPTPLIFYYYIMFLLCFCRYRAFR